MGDECRQSGDVRDSRSRRSKHGSGMGPAIMTPATQRSAPTSSGLRVAVLPGFGPAFYSPLDTRRDRPPVEWSVEALHGGRLDAGRGS